MSLSSSSSSGSNLTASTVRRTWLHSPRAAAVRRIRCVCVCVCVCVYACMYVTSNTFCVSSARRCHCYPREQHQSAVRPLPFHVSVYLSVCLSVHIYSPLTIYLPDRSSGLDAIQRAAEALEQQQLPPQQQRQQQQQQQPALVGSGSGSGSGASPLTRSREPSVSLEHAVRLLPTTAAASADAARQPSTAATAALGGGVDTSPGVVPLFGSPPSRPATTDTLTTAPRSSASMTALTESSLASPALTQRTAAATAGHAPAAAAPDQQSLPAWVLVHRNYPLHRRKRGPQKKKDSAPATVHLPSLQQATATASGANTPTITADPPPARTPLPQPPQPPQQQQQQQMRPQPRVLFGDMSPGGGSVL